VISKMARDDSNELGQMLKARRLMMPLTLKELTAGSGVSSSHLVRIEKGQRFPSARILRRLAKPLDIDESQLLIMAGYLSPLPSATVGDETEHVHKGLDPYVAGVLAQEPVEVQRTVIAILTILQSIAKRTERT